MYANQKEEDFIDDDKMLETCRVYNERMLHHEFLWGKKAWVVVKAASGQFVNVFLEEVSKFDKEHCMF